MQTSVMVYSLMSLAVLIGCFAVAETETDTGCKWPRADFELGDTAHANCTTYKCTQIKWKGKWYFRMVPHTRDCTVENTCHPLGSEYTMEDCKRYVCSIASSYKRKNTYKETYCQHEGKCQPPGSERVMNGCEREVCNRTSSGIAEYMFKKAENSVSACPTDTCCMNGTTYNDGEIFPPEGKKCVKYKCSKGDIITHRAACEHQGRCVNFTKYDEDNCTSRLCERFEAGRIYGYKMRITRTQCWDGKQCQIAGSEFMMNVCELHKCHRISDEKALWVLHIEKGYCCVRRQSFNHGDVFTRPGDSECLKFICIEGKHEIHTAACEYNGICIPLNGYDVQNCTTRTCKAVPVGSNFEYQTSVYRTDCQLNDSCVGVGSIDERNGCEKYVCKQTSDETAEFVFEKENTCCVQGKKYKDEEIFTPLGNSECIRFICSKGDVKIHTEDCQYGNKCYPVGNEYFRESCKLYLCTKKGEGSVKNVRSTLHCQDGNTCHPVGSKYFKDDCQRYTCKRISSKKSKEKIIERYCQYNNACYPAGSEFFGKDCQHFKCKQVTMKKEVILEPDGQYCQDGNKCHLIGAEYFMKGCLLHKCTEDNGKMYNKLLGPYCQHEMKCFPVGSVYTIKSCERYICTKISNDKAQPELVKEKTCCHREKVYSDGDIFTSYAQFQCLQFTCSDGTVILHTEACEYQSKCYPLGETLEQNCTTRRCTKHEWEIFHYEMIVTRARCRGDYGACHEDGETNVLKYYPDFKLYFHCKCTVTMSLEALINCDDRKVSPYTPDSPPLR